MENTFEYKGVYFYKGTPIVLADKLLALKDRKERIVLDYGDTQTGESWNEEHDTTEYIGKTTGTKPMLILVFNKRSLGGGLILTHSILTIKPAKEKTNFSRFTKTMRTKTRPATISILSIILN